MIENVQLLTMLNQDLRIRELYDVLDTLHGAASDNALPAVTSMDNAELVDWLRELIYTAQETINEIEKTAANQRPEPILRILERPVILERAE